MSDLDLRMPANINAERVILGASMLDNGILPQFLYELDPDDFYNSSHRNIFRAMRNLDRNSRAIDPLTLQNELEVLGQLELVGGSAFIASLIDGMFRPRNVGEYVKLIKEASLKRKGYRLGKWLCDESLAMDVRADELLDSLSHEVESLRESQIVDDLISSDVAVERTMEELEDRWQRGEECVGLKSGFVDLDKTILGFQGGKFYIIAAGTGLGKTTLALNIAHSILNSPSERPPVGLFISLEMSVVELKTKMFSISTRFDSTCIQSGRLSDEEKNAVRQSSTLIRRFPIEYVEGFSKVTASGIVSKLNKVKRKYGHVDFLIVDYLHLLDSDRTHENENMRLTEISRTLKRITLQQNIPVIALSQVNRSSADRGNRDYQLSDLRGSGSLEQDSDVVMFLMPEDWADKENPLRRLVVAKQRGGKQNVTIPLIFFGEQSRFENTVRSEVAPYINHQNGNKYRSNKNNTNNTKKSVKQQLEEYYEEM